MKELASQYAPDALAELARLATEAESEAVRVSASREFLDRAYGKSLQPLANDQDSSLGSPQIIVVNTGVPRGPDSSA